MTARNPADPLEALQISKELFAAQQNFFPSTRIYTQLADVTRSLTQANMAYAQALMRANAGLLAAFVERPSDAAGDGARDGARGGAEERPSDAAHRPDNAAP